MNQAAKARASVPPFWMLQGDFKLAPTDNKFPLPLSGQHSTLEIVVWAVNCVMQEVFRDYHLIALSVSFILPSVTYLLCSRWIDQSFSAWKASWLSACQPSILIKRPAPLLHSSMQISPMGFSRRHLQGLSHRAIQLPAKGNGRPMQKHPAIQTAPLATKTAHQAQAPHQDQRRYPNRRAITSGTEPHTYMQPSTPLSQPLHLATCRLHLRPRSGS